MTDPEPDFLAPPDSPDAPLAEGPPPVEGSRIAGRVTDHDGNPLVGVRVEAVRSGGADLDLLPVMTDGDGRFALEGLAEGSYDLRFVLGRVRGRTLAVPAGTADLGVRLARPQGIVLVVRVSEGETPPPLLHVVLERESANGLVREYEGRHTTTRMLLWSIRPGRYALTVWGGPWTPVQAPGIEVAEGAPAPLVEVLLSARGGVVRGRVRDADARPCAHPLVTWRRVPHPEPRPRDLSNATGETDGTFLLQGLSDGRYRVSAGPSGGPFAEAEVDVTAGEETEIELSLGKSTFRPDAAS